MGEVPESVMRLAAEKDFSGVVQVDRGGETEWAAAFGAADRRTGAANTIDTQFGIASGTKGFTALVVVSLIEEGLLALDTPARSVLGDDLPLVDDAVTVEQLLAHRSGIGDYFDEDVEGDINDYALTVPVHQLDRPEAYLPLMVELPPKFAPGGRFSYCNGGYVILALLAERVAGLPFPDLVAERVCALAGLRDTAFFRSDQLPGRAAWGYVEMVGEWRTNVFHLPVIGSGDGGIYSTVGDLHALWTAFFAGRIVADPWVAEMVRPRSDVPEESSRYGLGFWLHNSSSATMLVGEDAGVSFRSVHHPETGVTHTTISNTSDGAWPITSHLDDLCAAADGRFPR